MRSRMPRFVPSTKVPTHLGRFRTGVERLAGLGGPHGGNFLPDVFPAGRQVIEAAFGADVNADPSTWIWTDITGPGTVQWDPGVSITIGEPDESIDLVPAKFACKIRNDQPNGGDFTLGNPLGRFWPNVKENTPIRARLDVGNGLVTRFYGYASSWRPYWDAGRRLAMVDLRATGIGRRLKQGASAPRSPMWRFHMLSSGFNTSTNEGWPFSTQDYHSLPAHYWPLEEGSGAVRGANAVNGAYPLQAVDSAQMPRFGIDSSLLCTKTMPQFINGTALSVNFPVVRPTGQVESFDPSSDKGIRVQCLLRLDEAAISALESSLGTLLDGTKARVVTVEVAASSSLARVNVFLDHDAVDGLLLYAEMKDSADITLDTTGGLIGTVFERGVYITLDVVQAGTGIEVRFGQVGLAVDPGTASPDTPVILASIMTVASSTLNGVTGITLSGTENLEGGSIGQVSVYGGNADLSMPDRFPRALLGRTGDTVAERLRRYAIENNVTIDIIGDADLIMGPQGTAGFLDLVKECRDVDQGILLDGLGPGLTYITRTSAYSRSASLTLDAGNGDILTPLDTSQDDQGRTNDYTARNPQGSEAQFVQPDGALGTDTVGVYDSSGEHRAAFPDDLYGIAAWKVAQGTVSGFRYPRLEIELAKPVTSTKAQQWLDSLPFGRVDALSIEPGLTEPDRRFQLRGWNERWNSRSWHVTLNVAPYDPWSIVTLAADTGDAGDFVCWLAEDEGATTLVADVAAGASSFQVATVGSGPLWTTVADDIDGLHILVDGLKIAVTNITGASSPQTFTVTSADVLKALSAGTPVAVYNPPILGL